MAIPLTINGAVFEYPQNFDEDWGVDATGWAQAVTAGALYLSGGNFPLTSQVDFGTSFGIKVKSILSETTNPSTSGYLALAKSDTIGWRNNANSANLLLAVNGSDMLTFNGSALGLTSLTNTHIYVGNASNVPTDVAMSGDATIANTGALTIANSAITNVKVAAAAAIAFTKMAAQTASRAIVSDGSGFLVPATTTSTQIGYLSTTTSDVQTQLNARLPLAGGTMSGAISMASNKITSLTNGSSAGDAVAFNQLKVVQWVIGSSTTPFSTNSGTFQTTNLSASITPTSSSNSILVFVSAPLKSTTQTNRIEAAIFRGTTNTQSVNGGGVCYTATGGQLEVSCSMVVVDSPATTSATTYSVKIRNSNGAGDGVWGGNDAATQFIFLAELAS